MPFPDPEGRIRHLADLMHRAEDGNGDPITAGWVLSTDGTNVVGWVDPATLDAGGPDVTLVVVAATGAAETVDCSVARTYDLTLTANCTLTLTGAVNAEAHFLTLLLRQDGTGSRTVTWPASVEWPDDTAPTLATAANAVDTVTLLTVDGGTTWYGFPIGGGGGLDADEVRDVGHWEVIVSGTAPPVAVTNEAEDDWVYGWVAG